MTTAHDRPANDDAAQRDHADSDPGEATATKARGWRRLRWSLYEPVYDLAARPVEGGRRRAIEQLDLSAGDRVLLLGAGTGLDLGHLPADVSVTAVDISPRMVARTRTRAVGLDVDVDAQVGDATALPMADGTFDAVLLHLIVTVVADPTAVLAEAERVLATGGQVSVYDKFVPDDQEPSPARRAINPVASLLFSDVTRQLGPLVAGTDLAIRERSWHVGGLYAAARLSPAE